MNQTTKIIKLKLGLLEVAKQLENVQQAEISLKLRKLGNTIW
jgi:hypothetical protein